MTKQTEAHPATYSDREPDMQYTCPKRHSTEARVRTVAFEGVLAENVQAALEDRRPDSGSPKERLFHTKELLHDAARAIQFGLQRQLSPLNITVRLGPHLATEESFRVEAIASPPAAPDHVARRQVIFEIWLRHGEESGAGRISIILAEDATSKVGTHWEFSTYQELRARLVELTSSADFKDKLQRFCVSAKDYLRTWRGAP